MNRITFFIEGLVIYNRYFRLLNSLVYIEEMREVSKALYSWVFEAESYGWISWPYKQMKQQ